MILCGHGLINELCNGTSKKYGIEQHGHGGEMMV